ncbi:MAG: FAD-dependent oxidoreductase [Atopostipes sp.]|nr:FAD-dependent oxidoreductase [Atopostipes sp.]
MRIVVIGGVVAGTSAAIAARRNSEEAEIVIYDRDVDFNHSGYATHYVIGGQVDSIDKLTPKSVEWFKNRHNIDVHTSHEILEVDPDKKQVSVKKLNTGEVFQDHYDKLIFANGSSPTVPPVFRDKEFSNVFTVKNVQGGRELQACIDRIKPKNVVVVGGGYIGLGVSEQLKNLGMEVNTLEFLDHPMPAMDKEISIRIEDILKENGVHFHGGDGVTELVKEADVLKKVITAQGKEYSADLFILATGVRPNTELAESIGVELGESRAIKINDQLETNISDHYAVGDVAEAFHVITKEALYLPLATTAAKMGRAVGDLITGGSMRFNGVLGTSVVRLFDHTIGATGLSEKAALKKGHELAVMMNTNLSKLRFMGGEDILIKAVADKNTNKLLGAQIIGSEGVPRIIDVLATAMTFKAEVSDLIQLDLAFTPPISTPVDPVLTTGISLFHAIDKAPLITAEEMNQLMKEGKELTLVDIRTKEDYQTSHIKNANHLPVDQLRKKTTELTKDNTIILYSNTGEEAYIAQEILKNKGFEDVYALSGGINNYRRLHKENLIK